MWQAPKEFLWKGAAAAPAGRNRCAAAQAGRQVKPLPAACETRFPDKGL